LAVVEFDDAALSGEKDQVLAGVAYMNTRKVREFFRGEGVVFGDEAS